MSKILFIGDPHLKISKFDLACKFLEWINALIEQTKPDIVVNLGDTFDTHAVVRSEVTQEFRKHLVKTLSLDITYYYVLGNHDMYKPNDSKYHALQAFKGIHKNLVIVDKVIHEGGITWVPFLPDHRDFPKDTNPICVAHQTFVGADYGYIRPDVGVVAEDIAAEIIISGHIHMRQTFGKVVYPGTPYSQGLNDVNQSKGVMLFDTDTYNTQYIESPLPNWRSLSYELSPSLNIEEVHQDIASMVNDKDHWSIDVSGPKIDVLGYRDSKRYIELVKSKDVKFIPHFTDNDKKLINISSFSVDSIIAEYVNKVYVGDTDKKEIVSKAMEILDKVRQTYSKHKM